MSAAYNDNNVAKTFHVCFQECLPYLQKNAVVVIDNTSVHNKQQKGTPTSNAKKNIQEWIIKNNIEFSPTGFMANYLTVA